MLVCWVRSVSVIALLIIASIMIIVIMVVVFTVVVCACMVSTADGMAMTFFLPFFMQVNAASSMCWVGERCVWRRALLPPFLLLLQEGKEEEE